MRISIGSDHAGYELKEKVKQYINSKKSIEVNDWGCYSEERCDYPDFAHAVAKDVSEEKCDFGILICGSGNGINMSANKWSSVRSALCWNSEIANMARLHNDANILTMPGRYISEEEAFKCVDEFINTGFEGGRHEDRVAKISIVIEDNI
jgi:ribose 5-phosphate isomerase B